MMENVVTRATVRAEAPETIASAAAMGRLLIALG
jgi:hypothetical protein